MELILEFLPYAVVAVVFYNVGSHVRAVQTMLNLSRDPDRFIEMVKKIKEINSEVETNDMPEDASPMEVERVGDVLYAYDKHSGQFLAQAPNLNNLLEAVNTRFPDKKFFGTINKDNPAKELAK
jgi:hypothetical protein